MSSSPTTSILIHNFAKLRKSKKYICVRILRWSGTLGSFLKGKQSVIYIEAMGNLHVMLVTTRIRASVFFHSGVKKFTSEISRPTGFQKIQFQISKNPDYTNSMDFRRDSWARAEQRESFTSVGKNKNKSTAADGAGATKQGLGGPSQEHPGPRDNITFRHCVIRYTSHARAFWSIYEYNPCFILSGTS